MPRRRISRSSKIDKKGYKKLHKYCFFCGEDDYSSLQCHRIIPGEQGGTYHSPNTLTVCASCHCKIHGGRIKIDRKYTQASSPLFVVHYWLDEEEFWRNEEIGILNDSARNYHSGLGRSTKVSGKSRKQCDDYATQEKEEKEETG
jgi:hypothetical protein